MARVYAHQCARGAPLDAPRSWWLVCRACSPSFHPACQLCATPAPVLGEIDVFVGYAYGPLCDRCVRRVREAGPWRFRRALANERRAQALVARFEGLAIVERAPRVTHVRGEVEGRAVWIRLRLAAREGEDERYVYQVELHAEREPGECDRLALPEPIRARLAERGVTIVIDRGRWLRAAFAHLGFLDALTVLDAMLAAARELDAHA